MSGAPRALREQGRRSFAVLHAGCLKCESEIRTRKQRECFGETNPRALCTIAPLALFTLPLERAFTPVFDGLWGG